jgi:hypothetical protein
MAVVNPTRPIARRWLPAILAIYSVLLAITVYLHESFFDEAQAWLIARDLSPFQLFGYLPYEGSPGLWHIILMAPAKLGLPYGSMHIISAAVAAAAVAVMLWRSSFPPLVRVLLPFTYFLIYQYAVVARSYTLFPLVFFLTAAILPEARRRTWVFLLLLILMANISVHGTLAAIGILAAYLADVWKDRKTLTPAEVRRHQIACGVFLFALILIGATLRPKSDYKFGGFVMGASLAQKMGHGGLQIGQAFSDAPGGASARGSAPATAAQRIVKELPGMLASFLVLGLSVRWFYMRGTLLYFAFPAGALLLLSMLVYSNRWHSGVLFLVWLFAMWLTTGRSPEPTPAYMWAAWILVLMPQLYWSAKSIAFDWGNAYSGSKAAAAALQAEGLSDRVIFAAGYEAMALQPYFGRNLYANYHQGDNDSFWYWRKSNEMPQTMSSIPANRPDVLVVSLRTPEQSDAAGQLLKTLPQSGYVLDGQFDGHVYWKSSEAESESFLIIRKEDTAH